MKHFKLLHIPTLRECSMVGCMHIEDEFKEYIDSYYLNSITASWIGWNEYHENTFYLTKHQLYETNIKINKQEFMWIEDEEI